MSNLGTRSSKTPEQWAALRQRLALWYAMSPQERKVAGEPPTLTAWRERYGVSKKWTDNRRKDPLFQNELQQFERKRLTSPTTVTAFPETTISGDVSNAELFAEVLRSQLIAATQGDVKALEFVRAANISKPFIEQLTAEHESAFPDASDEELAEMFVDSFPDLCVFALRARGWTVTRANQE